MSVSFGARHLQNLRSVCMHYKHKLSAVLIMIDVTTYTVQVFTVMTESSVVVYYKVYRPLQFEVSLYAV